MKFGLGPFTLEQDPTQRADSPYRTVLEWAVLAEQLGFDSVWLDEAHGTADGRCPAPLVVAAAIAARTQALRLGIIPVLTLAHPLYLAEEVSVLDVLSNGRVIVCPTVSSPDQAPPGASTPLEIRERFREGVEILRLAWSGASFRYSGKHYRIPASLPANMGAAGMLDIAVTPFPAQPILTVWLPGWVAGADTLAASFGCPLLGSPLSTLSALQTQAVSRRPPQGTAGSAFVPLIPIIREVYVASSTETARREVEIPLMRRYGQCGGLQSEGFNFHQLASDRFIIGDPNRCIEEIQRYGADLGINYLICRMAFRGLDPVKVKTSMELFARHVAPAFRMAGPWPRLVEGWVQATGPCA